MKKTQNLLLLAVLFISAFLVVGRVNAQGAAWGIKDTALACDPEALEPGDTTKCYYAGKTAYGNGYSVKNAGFWTQMYTTDNLKIVEQNTITVNSNVTGGKAFFVSSASSSENINAPADAPNELKNNFKCPTINDRTTASQGCGIWYSTGDPAYDPDSLKAAGFAGVPSASAFAVSSLNNYVVLGAIQLKLDENNDVEKCGNLCIASYGIATNADWAFADCVNESMNTSMGSESKSCGNAENTTTRSTRTHGPESNGYFDCYEIKLRAGENPANYPETGAFVSYAILAAAALIALSAVTIAKKHNRLQKI